MCEYCGCRDIPLIGRLSEEHYEAVDALGELRRAIDTADADRVASALENFAGHLFPHNDSEEAGLFAELLQDEYFAPTVEELIAQHRLFRQFVERIGAGEWAVYDELEHTLRHHIDREENGLFPATAVAVDGTTWAEIDRLTHDFNHAHHREHFHSEADALAARRTAQPTTVAPHEHPHDHGHDHPHPHPRGRDHDHPHPHPDDHGTAGAAQTVASLEPDGGVREPVPSPEDVAAPPATAGLPEDAASRSYTVRPATQQDATELIALWRQCGLTVDDPQAVAEIVASVTALHPELVLVAVAGDSIVGSVLGTWDGRRGWVNRLATRPDRRGEGIASALLAGVEDGVRALGGRRLNLLIEADDFGVLGFFEARGYGAEDVILAGKAL